MIINWGDAPFKAFITVTYTKGTCTVTGEGQTYSHSGGGTHTFTVKKKGEYTVKATFSIFNDTKTATVNAFNQNVSVSMTYRYYIFKEGSGMQNGFSMVSTNSSAGSSASMSSIRYSNASYVSTAVYFNPTINLKDCSKLCMDLVSTWGFNGAAQTNYFGVGAKPNSAENPGSWAVKSANVFSRTRGTYSVSVASVNTAQYIKMVAINNEGNIYNIWLEP